MNSNNNNNTDSHRRRGHNNLPLASMQELVNSGALISIIILSLALCAHAATVGLVQVNNNQSVTSNGRPYWHRPGCHQVGHTRTISIPGCVKFNLSTNACRGFCMSFSIPATEDIGPARPLDQGPLDGGGGGGGGGGQATAGTLGEGARATPTTVPPTVEVGGTMDSQQLASMISGQVNGQPLIITRRMARESEELARARNSPQAGSDKPNFQMSEFLHLAGQTKSPLAGAVGDLSDRRDVISVGQCCNMMETEDVTINLRCGLNETRKLVFKSAKTCECFFCKHL